MNQTRFRSIITLSMIILLSSSMLIFNRKIDLHLTIPSLLIDHTQARDFSSLYENFVILSCSSDSYTSIYCYYLPYVALAWRRLGFEPVVFLVGSEEKFHQMPLINLLGNDLNIRYHFVNIDSARSIATSQIIRLFGGFLSYENRTDKDLFLLTADVDLVPISRRLFQIHSNRSNYTLAVNAYCCPNEKFTHQNFTNIHYYPISYVGMKQNLWKKIFSPSDQCSFQPNLTIDFIECILHEQMNTSIPSNVIKGGPYWDIDQRLLSVLIARAEYFHDIEIDKRHRGLRLDPNDQFLRVEFEKMFDYDDIHLPNRNESMLYCNQTWHVLREAFSNLFNDETIQLLARYHYQTAASILTSNGTNHSRKEN